MSARDPITTPIGGGEPRGRVRGVLLDLASRVLVENPTASLDDIAGAVGVEAAVLRRFFSTREALLRSLAFDALERLQAAYDVARLDQDPVEEALRRLVVALLALGQRMEFLTDKAWAGGDDVLTAIDEVNAPLRELIRRGTRERLFEPDFPVCWIVEALLATVGLASEAVADGRLTAETAAPLVTRDLLGGVGRR